MTHDISSRSTPRGARWQRHLSTTTELLCEPLSPQDRKHYPAAVIAYRRWFDTDDPTTAGALRTAADQQYSDLLADVATAVAVVGFAVDNGWLYADELDPARTYLAQSGAGELVEHILADVHARPRPAIEEAWSSC